MEAPDEQQQQQQCLLKQNNNYLLSPVTTPATITECVRVHACRVPSKIRQSNSKTAPAAPMRRAATALGSKQWTATTSGSRYESLVHFGAERCLLLSTRCPVLGRGRCRALNFGVFLPSRSRTGLRYLRWRCGYFETSFARPELV